jgi:hypothetical protein
VLPTVVEAFRSDCLCDSNNAAIILGQSCDAPEKSILLIEHFNLVPSILEMIKSHSKERSEAALHLLVSLTKMEPNGCVRNLLSNTPLASSLFKILSPQFNSYCKLLAAQWYYSKN